jgi:predicted nucleic acid-binding protein
MVVVDTDVLSELIRRRPDPALVARVRAIPSLDLHTTTINVMELRYGSARRVDAEAFWQRILDQILGRLTVLTFDRRAALVAGDLRVRLEREGRTIGAPDLLIASIAVANGATLMTRNVRHFGRIPDLVLAV